MAKKLKRPRDPISLAKMIGDIATGQVADAAPDDGKNAAARALGSLGGKARAASTTADRRAEIAKRAARARWEKK